MSNESIKRIDTVRVEEKVLLDLAQCYFNESNYKIKEVHCNLVFASRDGTVRLEFNVGSTAIEYFVQRHGERMKHLERLAKEKRAKEYNEGTELMIEEDN